MSSPAEHGDSAPPEPRFRLPTSRATLFHLSVLSAASFGLYGYTLLNGFVADDNSEVLKDPAIRSFAEVRAIFSHSVWYFLGGVGDRYYRPLKLVAYSVEYHLFGFHPSLWHLVNILIYVATVIAIYFLVHDLAASVAQPLPAAQVSVAAPGDAGPSVAARPAEAGLAKAGQLAFWTAVFFAFHPIHVEPVAWIAGGNDLECGLVLLLSLWLYHRALYQTVQGRACLPRHEDSSGHLRRVGAGFKPAPTALLLYGLSVVAFFAGLLFKETALTLPAAILAYDFCYRGESLREMLRAGGRYLAYFAALGGYLALRIHALSGFAPGTNILQLTTKEAIFSIPTVAVKYPWKALLPIHQNFWYAYQPVRALGWESLAASAFMLALVLAVFWLRRRQPLLSFALAWFLLFLIPVLDLSKISLLFTDRYVYLPSFGFCVFAAWAWLWLRERASGAFSRRAAYGCLVVVLAFYTTVIARRLPDWRDELPLFTKAVKQSPNSPLVMAYVGRVYFTRGLLEQGLGYFQRAEALDPANPLYHSQVANAYWILGRPDDALREAQKAVQVAPSGPAVWSNLCLFYNVEKEWKRAIDACRRSLALQPDLYAALAQLGLALWNDGQPGAALTAERRAIQLGPAQLDAHFYLAICLAELGQRDAATSELLAGLRTDPQADMAYLAHYELGAISQLDGRWNDAAQEYRQALEMNPNFVPARRHLEEARAHLANRQP